MSRYDWPPPGRSRRKGVRRGLAAQRQRYNASLDGGFGADQLLEARAARHATAADHPVLAAAPPAGGPHPDRNLWLPLGPAGTLRGQADSDPRVAGRVRDVRVSADGQRAYAATANGGLWYTDSAGARWEPVGPWAMVANPNDLVGASHTLNCGAVQVRFDPAGNDAANDEVWVLTGEPGSAGVTPVDRSTTVTFGGVGVLFARGPVTTSRNTPLADPWTREAQPRPADGANPAYRGLRGAGVFSVAADPANDRHLVAASTVGLHERTPGAVGDPWTQVRVAAWEALAAGSSARVAVCDVAWLPLTGAHPGRLWVTIVGAPIPALNGLWVSTNGTTGPFVNVPLPGIAPVQRLGLAADPAFPDVLYVLGSGPQLWRVDGQVARAVANVPEQLFQLAGGNDQSGYDLALAVDPGNANRLIVGGSAAQSPFDGSFSAALYRLTLAAGGPPYATDYVPNTNAADPTWIGAEVHADVHRVRSLQVAGATHVWVCCDGGIWRSVGAGGLGTFASRSAGLAVTEASFLALHPFSDGAVLIGVQDNGTQLRIGESAWRRVAQPGDGGGVAFDPGAPGRFAGQSHNASWRDDADTADGISPGFRGNGANFVLETVNSRFYGNAAVIRRPADGATQLAVGTIRVWYSEQWGRSHRVGAIIRRQWDALPSVPGAAPAGLADPRAGDPADPGVRSFIPNAGPIPPGVLSRPGIYALRWGSPDRLYVLQRGAVHRLDRAPAGPGGQWSLTTIMTRPAAPAVAPAAPVWPVAAATLPFDGGVNDIAVHSIAAAPHGSLYVAMSHPLEPLWWFDGTATWHPCRLGTEAAPPPPPPARIPIPARGVRAPAYAVVVDPGNQAVVYVGTAVGVWRGVLNLLGPSWTWEPFNSGLPEAGVQDLAMASWPNPAGGQVTLLRAALQSRGVWELEPGVDAAPRTYLRVHPYDGRRIVPTDQRDPLWNAPTPEREWPLDWADRRNRDYRTGGGLPRAAPDGTPAGSYPWHASPDIRLRPANGGPLVPPPPDLPWVRMPASRFWLWSLQTALATMDPLIVTDGRWTAWWARRLAATRVSLGLPGTATVDAALWDNGSVQLGFWSTPWAPAPASELDLVERVVGLTTPRVGGPSSAATSPAGAAVLRRPYRVDVLVHHRGREPVVGTTVAVALLQVALPAAIGAWAGMAPIVLPGGAPPTPLHQALDALPDLGGALPAALVLPPGWVAADAGTNVRRLPAPVATGAPAAVTFNVDFSHAAAGSRVLLVALAHSTVDPIVLTGADVRAMVLGSRHACARSVQVT